MKILMKTNVYQISDVIYVLCKLICYLWISIGFNDEFIDKCSTMGNECAHLKVGL